MKAKVLVNILANRLPEVEAERVVDTLAKVTTEAVVKTLRWRLDNRNRQTPLPSPRPVLPTVSTFKSAILAASVYPSVSSYTSASVLLNLSTCRAQPVT